jgi:hypothetical protein
LSIPKYAAEKRDNSKADLKKACSKKFKNVNNKEDEVSQGSESDSQLVEKNVKTGQENNMNSDKSDEESQSQSQSKPCLSKNLASFTNISIHIRAFHSRRIFYFDIGLHGSWFCYV